MLINDWAWLKSHVCLLWLEIHFGSVFESGRALTEMKIWCVKGIYMLKAVSSEKKLGF